MSGIVSLRCSIPRVKDGDTGEAVGDSCVELVGKIHAGIISKVVLNAMRLDLMRSAKSSGH